MEKSAMEAFEKLEKVGEGTYGKVYRAREKATGKIVALKKTRLHEDDEGVPPTTLREVSLLRMPIVRLMDVKQGQNKEGKTVLYLVFEYMDTDLKKFIRTFRQTGENIPTKTIKESLKALLRMRRTIKEKELEALLGGEQDCCSCFIEVQAGAGGTESMDWASMVMQMYKMWAQRRGFGVTVVDEMAGEIAAIKILEMASIQKSAKRLNLRRTQTGGW